jgi:hypothetical protein
MVKHFEISTAKLLPSGSTTVWAIHCDHKEVLRDIADDEATAKTAARAARRWLSRIHNGARNHADRPNH